jgi:1-acyl-sn-glycerol-3-phosphate acyltransferase
VSTPTRRPDEAAPPEAPGSLPFSLYCWTSGFVWMVATSLHAMLAYPFRTPVEQSTRSARAWRRILDVTRTRVTTVRDDAFDASTPSVFCFNHTNVLDAHTACATIPQPFVGLMLAWHFKIPGYGWMMKATHGIPVHPASSGRTDELVAHAKDRAAHGLSILVFPEGHRTRDGRVGPYKRGMFFMARSAGLPIVPVAVRGMFEVNRKGSFVIRPGDVSVYLGPQLDVTGMDDAAITSLAAEVQARVAAYVEGRDVDGNGIAELRGFAGALVSAAALGS